MVTNSDEVKITRSKRLANFVSYGVPSIIVGTMIGFYLANSGHGVQNHGDTVKYDNNEDGQPDVFYYYTREGILDRIFCDRNFDEKIDSFEFYSDGLLSRSEADDNFDNAVDNWGYFTNGYFARQEKDTDFNGVADVTCYFENDVLVKATWHPNGGKIVRVEFFKRGVKSHEQIDLDGDGVFEAAKHFDAFGNKRLDGPRTE